MNQRLIYSLLISFNQIYYGIFTKRSENLNEYAFKRCCIDSKMNIQQKKIHIWIVKTDENKRNEWKENVWMCDMIQ